MKELKFVVMGSAGVGKSALTLQFVDGRFEERYDPTIEDCYSKSVEYDGQNYAVEILDTAGTEMFAAMREMYMKNGQGFVLVYSITSSMSFDDLIKLREKVIQVKQTPDVPMILVGNKCDLDAIERAIPKQRGQELAAAWKCPFFETSAKNNENVQNVFTSLISEVNKFAPENRIHAGGAQRGGHTGGQSGNPKKANRSTKCPSCTLL